jgi:hypothetical protein
MLLEHHIKNRCIRPLSFHTEKEDWAPPWIRSGPEAGPNFKIVELFGEINNTKHKALGLKETKQRSYLQHFTTWAPFKQQILKKKTNLHLCRVAIEKKTAIANRSHRMSNETVESK